MEDFNTCSINDPLVITHSCGKKHLQIIHDGLATNNWTSTVPGYTSMIFPTKPPWLRPGAAPNHPTSDHFYHVIQGSSKMFKKKKPTIFWGNPSTLVWSNNWSETHPKELDLQLQKFWGPGLGRLRHIEALAWWQTRWSLVPKDPKQIDSYLYHP